MAKPTPTEIVEYRGVEGLVAAEVLCDDNVVGTGHGYVTGDVFAVAGVAEISKTTDSSSEAHYYDNIPAVVVTNTSADTITISASAIPNDVIAKLTGQKYDDEKGALIEGTRELKYYAIGYVTKKTNGDLMYCWRYKCSCNVPDQTNATENDGTDANGQEIVFTGISTTHKFTNNADSNGNARGAKALVVDVAKGLADVDAFFDTVTTPDSLAKKAYTLSITSVAGATVSVTKGGTAVSDGATIHIGDELVISVTGTNAAVKVNGDAFESGDTFTVAGNTAVEGYLTT